MNSMKQALLLAALARLKPATPQQARLLCSLASSSSSLSNIRGYAGEHSGDGSAAPAVSECSPLGPSALPALPSLHPATHLSSLGLQRDARFQGAGRRPGFRVCAAGMSALPQVDAADRTYCRTEEVPVRPLHQHTKEQLSLKAQVIFEGCWKRLEEKYKDRYVCPREVVWLNGAPGSGKGTNMPFIMKSRGLSRTVTMSQLLDGSAEIKNIIDRGELVPDNMVLDALLDAILNPDINDGAGLVIDGFPRTALQVDFVKLLYDKLLALHLKHADGPDEMRFPRPSFKVVILYVDEEESVRRQMKRAQLASLHNKRVMEAGAGDVWDVRTTDVNEALTRRRYQVFKAHYHTILRLKQYFPFSLIDAMGSLEECRQQIMRELRYQSSLDLDEGTYAAIRHLPLARDLVRVARQRLVFRLDSYCKRHNKLFLDVIKMIDAELIPLLKQCSLAGHAEYQTRNPLLMDNNLSVDMLIDVLSDRGFSVAHSAEERLVPERVDLKTGEIETRVEVVHKFRVTFEKENVRDLSTPTSVTSKQGEDIGIGTTYVPSHLQREESKVEHPSVVGPHCILPDLVPPPPKKKEKEQVAAGAAGSSGTQYMGGAAVQPNGEAYLMEAPVLSLMQQPATQRLPGDAPRQEQRAMATQQQQQAQVQQHGGE